MALDFGLRDTDCTRIYHTMQGDVTGVEAEPYLGDDADFDQDEANEEFAESSAVDDKSEALAKPHTATASETEEVLYDILASADPEPSAIPLHANVTSTGTSEPNITDRWSEGFPDLFDTNDSYEGFPDLFGANGSFTEFPYLVSAEETATEQPATTYDTFSLLQDQDATISAQSVTIANLCKTVAKLEAELAEAKATIDMLKSQLRTTTIPTANKKPLTGKVSAAAVARQTATKRKLLDGDGAMTKGMKKDAGKDELDAVPEYTPPEPIEGRV